MRMDTILTVKAEDLARLSPQEAVDFFRIMDYVLVKDHIHRWIEFCNGSPRVAHVLGQNLKENPRNLLASPDTVDFWGHYIAGGDKSASEEVRQRRIVLRHI